MKKYLLMLMSLVLCVCCFASCASLLRPMHKSSAASDLDKLQAELEEQEYGVLRADEAEIAAWAESFASDYDLILEGELAGVLEYSGIDPDTGKMVLGIVFAVTDKADAKEIAKVYREQADDAQGVSVDVTVKGRMVTVVYS